MALKNICRETLQFGIKMVYNHAVKSSAYGLAKNLLQSGGHMAANAKFRNGTHLGRKRSACAPIEDEIRRLASADPKGFRALTMPSPNMHDINLLLKAGMSIQDLERNVSVVERDKPSFIQIWNSLRRMGISPNKMMTSRPMGLGKRVAALDGPLDWMNLDMFGPIYGELCDCVEYLASRCFRENSCLQITVKCAREHVYEKKILRTLNAVAVAFLIPRSSDAVERRKIALFMLLAGIPALFGWTPTSYIPALYREDREGGKAGISMLCHAAVYRKEKPRLAQRRVAELWKDIR